MSLKEDKSKNILVIGIGNPLRSDDGVGPYVADCIEARSLCGVKVWVTQQLNVEDLEGMLAFDRVILVDASTVGGPIDFHQVGSCNGKPLASSHHLSPETFVDLARTIHHKDLALQLCSIRGHRFEVGDKISAGVLACAKEAVERICASLKGVGHARRSFYRKHSQSDRRAT